MRNSELWELVESDKVEDGQRFKLVGENQPMCDEFKIRWNEDSGIFSTVNGKPVEFEKEDEWIII